MEEAREPEAPTPNELELGDVFDHIQQLRRSGNRDEARKVLERATRAGLDVSFEWGLLLEDLGQVRESVDWYLRSENPAARFNAAFILYEQGKWDTASHQFEWLLARDELPTNARRHLGDCYDELGNYELAEKHFRAGAAAMDHENSIAMYGNFLRMRGRWDEAREVLDEAEQKGFDVSFEYGCLLHDAGELEGALAKYLESNMSEAHMNAALVLHDLGRDAESREQFLIAIDAGDAKAARMYDDGRFFENSSHE